VHKDLSRYGFDFFMAAQNVERGCCTPTHYVCLHNDSDLTQSELMKLTFWQCFGYFGWSGAVKVPCVLQYAKKLSMQGGDVVKRDYNENMDGLHFI
jgi:aubergine